MESIASAAFHPFLPSKSPALEFLNPTRFPHAHKRREKSPAPRRLQSQPQTAPPTIAPKTPTIDSAHEPSSNFKHQTPTPPQALLTPTAATRPNPASPPDRLHNYAPMCSLITTTAALTLRDPIPSFAIEICVPCRGRRVVG